MVRYMKIPRESAFNLLVFLVFVIVFSALGYWLIFRLGRATPLMLAVGAATILTCLVRKRKLTTLGWAWGSWGYQWLSYLLPLFIVFVSFAIIWLAGFGEWYDSEFVLQQAAEYNLTGWNNTTIIVFHLLLTATYSFVMAFPSVLGEEIGWRGFLVPELAAFLSFTQVALISGLLWSVWHWPLIFMGLYGAEGTPLYYQLFFFTVLIVSWAVILTYLRIKTDSVWTAVVFHASANVFLQKFFVPLTRAGDSSAWFMDEFGAVPALVSLAVATYYWRKGAVEFKDLNAWGKAACGPGR